MILKRCGVDKIIKRFDVVIVGSGDNLFYLLVNNILKSCIGNIMIC